MPGSHAQGSVDVILGGAVLPGGGHLRPFSQHLLGRKAGVEPSIHRGKFHGIYWDTTSKNRDSYNDKLEYMN